MPATLVRKRSFIVTLGLLTGVPALTVDMSLPAVPEMVRALDTVLPKGQLIVGIFMLGMAVGQIPSGLFSDRVGRLPVMYAGMLIYGIAGTIATVAGSIEVMLAARFVQGIGAASAIVLTRAVVRDITSGKEAAKLMSLLTMIFTVAPVVAPSFGAFMTAHWGWRSPFAVLAVCGFLLIWAMIVNVPETHEPNRDGHPLRQLQRSATEFFAHRQSIFGLLLIIVPPLGFMSVIAVSAAVAVEIYGYEVQTFGLLFAIAGLSVMAGSFANRLLVTRLDLLPLMAVGVGLIALSSMQLVLIAWLDAAPYAWLWGCVCLFFFSIPILMSNATVLALDPLPRIAGVASSIIGTLQNICGATGAMIGAAIYDGSVRNAVLMMACAGTGVTLLFLLRPVIAPGPVVHHPDELARD